MSGPAFARQQMSLLHLSYQIHKKILRLEKAAVENGIITRVIFSHLHAISKKMGNFFQTKESSEKQLKSIT